jgi:hypothetical protein
MNLEIKLDGQTLVNIDINTQLAARAGREFRAPLPEATHSWRSTPMTVPQARELLSKIDPKSKVFLLELARKDGTLSWRDMRAIYELDAEAEWSVYSRGWGKGITRALRFIMKDNSAKLVWWNDDQWDELEEDDVDRGLVHIDGPALAALQACL